MKALTSLKRSLTGICKATFRGIFPSLQGEGWRGAVGSRDGVRLFVILALLSSCSTTDCLEEGDVLYTGIEEITYNLDPQARKLTKKQRRRLAKQQEKGVITAVDEAVTTVSDIIHGVKGKDESAGSVSSESLVGFTGRGAERAEARAQQEKEKQFEAVQTEVDAVLACEPNGALFGSSSLTNPMQLGLRIYNKYHDSSSRFGKWMLKRFGSEPVLISTVSPQTRAKVATNQLHNFGFFRATTDFEVLPQKNPQKARVAYHIQTGPLYLIDSLRYASFTPHIDSLLRTTRRQRLLKKGTAFSAANLVNERTRIENLLRENGYYNFTASAIRYEADTINHPLFVSLRVLPAIDSTAVRGTTSDVMRPWKMGHTYITLYDNTNTILDTLLERRTFHYAFHGPKPPVKPAMWLRAILHRRGQPYRLSDQTATLEKLSAMGILSQINLDYMPASPDDSCDVLDTYVTATMDRLYESAFEMNATLKSNHQFGPGLSYELAKKNAFRAGEKVSWKIFGQYEWHLGGGGGSELNSYELGSELALTFPRFLLYPQRRQRFAATTRFALDVDWKNRSGFFNMIQSSIGVTYSWSRHRMQHDLVPFDFEFNRLLSTTTAFDSITQANPALYVSMRDQFIPSMSYGVTYTGRSQKNPLWLQAYVKQAGNITGGIFAACGKGWNSTDKKVLGSPFAQFLKITAEAHKTWTLSQRFSLASRLFCGTVYTYGNSSAAPYTELFYAGGANSVRGFAARSIGPGGYRSPVRRYAYIDQTGDFKLEGNLEFRAQLLGNLHGAVFLDAGNVWLLHDDPLRPDSRLTASNLKRIALGTGVGLRYDLTFLVLRVDFGIGLHAPYDTPRSGFYNIERFRDGYALHFAIGYPF
ncbi:MAG: BamA/TamA family outer membrane protein [Bacteroidaceae bacterium]|nr:BamA/TamA family outer membrane protein [Bacteroidaceae bacterium]